ncbi:MAG: hypothetical protein IT452_02615 [Planctomycetia bacterium]|nr:hypothetical protein [Planctomycetia bacterium]
MAEGTENAGGILDARKAKAVFVLGVGLYLLMTFWTQSPTYKMAAMASKGEQLQAMKSHELERPYLEPEPQKPNDKAKDFAKLTEQYNELKKKWDEKKKKHDDELIPAYQRDEWKFVHEEQPELNEEGEELERDYKWAKATKDNWCYWAFVGRFIACVLMLVGLAFTAVNGSEWERAAAIVVIGLVLIGTGGVMGR